jgi:hypothetical protein
MARRRYQKGSIRQRGKRDPVWEVLFWTDIIKSDGSYTQAQLGHTQLSTTLEIYTLPLPAHQREAVENLSRLVDKW